MKHDLYHMPKITDLEALRKTASQSTGKVTIHFHKHGEPCEGQHHERNHEDRH